MANSSEPPAQPEADLRSPSFTGLLLVQFFGAMNDNMFRWLVVLLGKDLVGDDNEALALSLGLACLVLPFILFAAPAAYLSDRFSKSYVITGCKVAEIVLMGLGVAAIWYGDLYLMAAVLFCMGTQSALYGPAKLGSIPEMLRVESISAANGAMGMTTIVAVLVGTVCGFEIYGQMKQGAGLWLPAAALLGVAVVGWGATWLIQHLPSADRDRKFPWLFVVDTWKDLRRLGSSRPLLRAALGSAFFWALASLAQLNVDLYGTDVLRLEPESIDTLLVVLAIGVGVGNVLAGWLSEGRIELGLTPLGALGITVAALALAYRTTESYTATLAALAVLGMSAGFFEVPLAAFLQHRSPKDARGSILAAANFLTFSGMLLVAGLFYLMKAEWGLGADAIFLMAGLCTIPVFVYVVMLLPFATARFLIWCLAQTVYRVRVYGRRNLPEEGGALLIANHVTWIDGAVLLLSSARPIHMIAHSAYISFWPANWICKLFGVIPIDPRKGPKAIIKSLRAAKAAIEKGELVCIFAEGALTRTGQLMPFRPGFMKIIDGTEAPVIPVYLDELWGSIFSYAGGKFFFKMPRQWPYPISVFFGKPIENPENVYQVRQAVQELGVVAVETRKDRMQVLPRRFVRKAKSCLRKMKVADSTGQEATGGQLLLRSIILSRLLKREVLEHEEAMVGVLLPPSMGAVLVNAALSMLHRTSVNLNYSASADTLNSCIRQCGMKHILTSRKVAEKLELDLDAEYIYVDDLKDKVTLGDKLTAVLMTYVLPASVVDRMLGLTEIDPDDPLTIVFTSGSTGEPKGVMLSYHNVGSNVAAMDQMVDLKDTDCLLGILPFFHSFGMTTSLWTVLTLDPKAVFHFSPLDARQIGKLAEKFKATILMSTPTFLRTYLRRLEPEQFKSLELVIVGAEKMPLDLADAFEKKFSVRPFEGYGATELSPLVSVNLPNVRSLGMTQVCAKEGSVGRLLPGVHAKIVDPETDEELGPDEPGMLLIKGPNVMTGYLGRPELTAEKIQDGWYVTGDIAKIDNDGFITITGRQSRFSKIGGEMVPHIMVEEKIAQILGGDGDIQAVVTSVPDEKKGERLVVLHVPIDKSPEEIRKALAAEGLPNLWIPANDSYVEIEEIPVLGSGKLALSEINRIAKERFAKEPASTD